MKKAVIILYVIVIVLALCTIFGFALSYKFLQLTLYESARTMGEKTIQICDQRYVQK